MGMGMTVLFQKDLYRNLTVAEARRKMQDGELFDFCSGRMECFSYEDKDGKWIDGERNPERMRDLIRGWDAPAEAALSAAVSMVEDHAKEEGVPMQEAALDCVDVLYRACEPLQDDFFYGCAGVWQDRDGSFRVTMRGHSEEQEWMRNHPDGLAAMQVTDR